VVGDDILNLRRIHVLAAGDEHILFSSLDIEVPVLVDARQVARRHPRDGPIASVIPVPGAERRGGLGPVAPVAVPGVGACKFEFAHLAGREFLPLVVDNASIDVQTGGADAVGLLPPEPLRHREVVGATFSQPVSLRDSDPAVGPGVDGRLPTGAAAAFNEPQR